MNDTSTCFIIERGEYRSITYKELVILTRSEDVENKKYFIALQGMLLEVSQSEYKDFYRNIRRQKYLDEEAVRNGMFSYNALDVNDMLGEEIICDTRTNVEDIVIDNMMKEKLYQCIARLNEDEISLINALFFEGKSERQWSKETGVPQRTINYRKQKTLKKLKILIEN